jgi:hypothetical protein
MKLEIPESDRQLLKKWLASDEYPTDQMLSFLEKADPALREKSLGKELATATGIPVEAASDLLEVLFSMVHTVSRLEEDEKENAPSLIARSVLGEVAEVGKRELFEARVKRIIHLKAIEITGKALGVLLDNQNTFCLARTLSELRPIFSEGTLEPRASVIVHQLKIVYHAGTKRDRAEVFIACDARALRTLRKVIDRALDKQEKMVSLSKKLELPVL